MIAPLKTFIRMLALAALSLLAFINLVQAKPPVISPGSPNTAYQLLQETKTDPAIQPAQRQWVTYFLDIPSVVRDTLTKESLTTGVESLKLDES